MKKNDRQHAPRNDAKTLCFFAKQKKINCSSLINGLLMER